jgi:hypothetical protein
MTSTRRDFASPKMNLVEKLGALQSGGFQISVLSKNENLFAHRANRSLVIVGLRAPSTIGCFVGAIFQELPATIAEVFGLRDRRAT